MLPPDTVSTAYLPGQTAKATFRAFIKNWAILRLPDGRYGVLFGKGAGLSGRKTQLQEFFKLGDEVEVVVDRTDVRKHNAYKLHLCRLPDDPWKQFCLKYLIGSLAPARVIQKNDHGYVVELPFQQHGLMQLKDPNEDLSFGDEVTVLIYSLCHMKRLAMVTTHSVPVPVPRHSSA